MKKTINKIKDIFWKSDDSHPVSYRVDQAIKFTVHTYGDTFKDLAKYDRGEQLTR